MPENFTCGMGVSCFWRPPFLCVFSLFSDRAPLFLDPSQVLFVPMLPGPLPLLAQSLDLPGKFYLDEFHKIIEHKKCLSQIFENIISP